MGHDVFISHSTKDKDAADAFCAALEASGIRCWIAPRDIKPGKTWAASIVHGINQSRLMVLVFSAHANESKHVCREVERADTRGIPILTLRIQDVMPQGDLEYFLSNSQWLEALTPPLSKHLPEFIQQVQATLPPRPDDQTSIVGQRPQEIALPAPEPRPVAGPPGSTAPTAEDARKRWALFVDTLPIPKLSEVLLPAWTAARDQFRDAVNGNETDVRTKLTQLAERLGTFEHELDSQIEGLSETLGRPAATKRKELLQRAFDAVRTSPRGEEFPDEERSALQVAFSEWVKASIILESARAAFAKRQLDAALAQLDGLQGLERDAALRKRADDLRDEIKNVRANNLLESAKSAFSQHQLDTALAKLDDFNGLGGDAALQKRADELRDEIEKAKVAENDLRNAVQEALDDKQWLKAWKTVDALDKQAGRKETQLREEIVDALVNAAETKGDSGTWKFAIDLLTQFGRLGDGDKGVASLQGRIAADLLKAAGSKADGDATARREALNLLSQLDRVSKENAKAAELRRHIDGQGYYETAAARLREGAFQEAADNYRKASERSYPVSAERLQIARSLADADTLLLNDKAAVEQLEAALENLEPTPEFNPDEQAQASALSTKIQSVLVRRHFEWAQVVDAIPTPALSEVLLPAWTAARDRFHNAVAGNEADVRTQLTQLADRLNALDQALVAQSNGLNPTLAAAAAAKRMELLQKAVDAVKGSLSADEFPHEACSTLESRFCEWVRANNVLESARSAFAGHQIDIALAKLNELNGSVSDAALQDRADELRDEIKRAKDAESDLRRTVQAAVDDKQWLKAWKTVDALDKQTGCKESQLRDGIVEGIVNAAEKKGDSGTWKVAIDLLTQFGRLGDASLQGRIAADLLKAAGSKADGDSTVRREALNLLSQLDRVSKENAKAAELRRHIDGQGYYETAAARLREGAFQEAADNYQKASERSYLGSGERLQIARSLAVADTLLQSDKAAVEQLESALKSLNPTPGFNPDEQAQATALSKKIQSVLAGKYFELADGQETATPPDFAAAVVHYQKSADYGRQDSLVRRQAAQQLIDVQKLTGLAAIKRLDDIQASLNDAEQRFATSLRKELRASLEERLGETAQLAPAIVPPLEERPREKVAELASALPARPREERPGETAQPASRSLKPPEENRTRGVAQRPPGSLTPAQDRLPEEVSQTAPGSSTPSQERGPQKVSPRQLTPPGEKPPRQTGQPVSALPAQPLKKHPPEIAQQLPVSQNATREKVAREISQQLPGSQTAATEKRPRDSTQQLPGSQTPATEKRPRDGTQQLPGSITASLERRPQEIAQRSPALLTPPSEKRPNEVPQGVPTSLVPPPEKCPPPENCPEEIGQQIRRRRLPVWAKVAATAAGLAICAGGVFAYQSQRLPRAVARKGDTPPEYNTQRFLPTSSPATAPTTTPHDAREHWAQFVDAIPTPALSDVLLPAWTAARDQCRNTVIGNETEVRTKLTHLGEDLDALDKALVALSKGVSPGLAAPAAEKRKQLLHEAVDIVKASLPPADFSNDGTVLIGQFSEWARASNVLEAARSAYTQHQDAIALAKLDELKEPVNDADVRHQAEQLRGEINGAQQADLDAARALLLKPDTAGASRKVCDLLKRAPQNLDAQKLRDDIARAALSDGQKDEQQGDIAAAQASYEVLSELHPSDSATQKHYVELVDAKKLVDDARTQIKARNWQSAAKNLSDLGAKPGSTSAANLLWPDVENGLLADATAKGDAASWKGAIDILESNTRLPKLKQRVIDGLLSSAGNKASAHTDTQVEALLVQVDRIAPNNPGASDIRKGISEAKARRDQIDALVRLAVSAESKGDFAGAAAEYAQASKYDPGNDDLRQRSQLDASTAATAANLEKQARAKLNEGNPAAALKLVNDSDARTRKAQLLTALSAEVTMLQASAQKNYDLGTEALRHNSSVEAFKDFFYSACGGSPEGMLKLGDIYKNGQGVKADDDQARAWWQRAANAGNSDAKERLKPKAHISPFDPGRS